MSTSSPSGANSRELFGHPAGLYLLFSTELWERFSYYAMRALLVLYLTDAVTSGGLGWNQGDALQLYGIFTGLVYITPMFGGALADNWLGARRAILIGGLIMAAGQFVLAVPPDMSGLDAEMLLYVGLGLLIVGNGLFKPNISTMVGDLYPQGDHRRDGAFTIFYMGINLGALLSGIVAGSMAEGYGWNAGFLVAGIGMLLAVAIQLIFAPRHLGELGVEPSARREARLSKRSTTRTPLSREERDRIKVILVLGLFTILFWAGFEQGGGLMALYAQDYTDRMLMGFEVPAAWFQSLNPLFIILLSPLLAGLWTRMNDREPSSPVKFAFGLIALGIGFVCMIGAVLEQKSAGSASMMWLVGAFFFHTLGELCLSPVGLSMVTKLSPVRMGALMMGAWFAFVALANYLAGMIGSLVGEAGAMSVFGGIAITGVLGGLLLLVFAGKLVDWMHGAESRHDGPLEPQTSHG
ncbi:MULTISPECIES: peptide MFS transporter [Cobetia]|uniref:peptide MFS transporter n=1 Tax=Cobetia TaxID=204286 RepID=UPI0008660B02|nr:MULTISPECIES: peptide MFS transporter [Cobetia]AOM02286.1 dipeptide/tripeptide permease [Cobetia marina]AZV32126.1 MFS transporter [Cobetia sp. ICG0124]